MDSLRTYPLEAAAEICGLNKDTLWRVCDKVGLDPDAVPLAVVQELRTYTGAIVGAYIAKAYAGAAETRRRVSA